MGIPILLFSEPNINIWYFPTVKKDYPNEDISSDQLNTIKFSDFDFINAGDMDHHENMSI